MQFNLDMILIRTINERYIKIAGQLNVCQEKTSGVFSISSQNLYRFPQCWF